MSSPSSADSVKFGFTDISTRLADTENRITVSASPGAGGVWKRKDLLPLLSGIQYFSLTKDRPDYECQDRAFITFIPTIKQDDSAWKKVFERAYARAAEQTNNMEGGSTATSVIVTDKKILVAWLGDSPAMILGIHPETYRVEKIKGLNKAHIPVDDIELLRQKGGEIEEGTNRLLNPNITAGSDNHTKHPGQYSLSMSRALGNSWLDLKKDGEKILDAQGHPINLLIREPSFASFDREPMYSDRDGKELEQVLVISSDGLISGASEATLMHPTIVDKHGVEQSNFNFTFNTLFDFFNGENIENEPILFKPDSWGNDATKWQAPKMARLSHNTLRHKENGLSEEYKKKNVGYIAADDATVLNTKLSKIPEERTPYYLLLSVMDGHRTKGEKTAETGGSVIHKDIAIMPTWTKEAVGWKQ